MSWLRMLFPFGLTSQIAPPVAAALIGGGVGLLGKLFGGGGGGVDLEQFQQSLLDSIRNVGGAAGRQDEAILRRNLAGASRLQTQGVLGQQLSRNLESTFAAMGPAQRAALGLVMQRFGAQQAQTQRILGTLAELGQGLGGLLQGSPATQTQTPKPQV